MYYRIETYNRDACDWQPLHDGSLRRQGPLALFHEQRKAEPYRMLRVVESMQQDGPIRRVIAVSGRLDPLYSQDGEQSYGVPRKPRKGPVIVREPREAQPVDYDVLCWGVAEDMTW